MHGIFFFVLKELIAMKDQVSRKFDLAVHLDHCEQNFVAAIETYEVLAVPSFENILALTMGVSFRYHMMGIDPILLQPIFTRTD